MSTSIDLLARIKNGYVARNEHIMGVHSKMNLEILRILKQEGYIEDYKETGEGSKKEIELFLKYNNGDPVMTDMKIFSKPGKRLYMKVKEIKPVLGGFGISILSTPKGLKSGKEAKKEKLGGEILFQVW